MLIKLPTNRKKTFNKIRQKYFKILKFVLLFIAYLSTPCTSLTKEPEIWRNETGIELELLKTEKISRILTISQNLFERLLHLNVFEMGGNGRVSLGQAIYSSNCNCFSGFSCSNPGDIPFGKLTNVNGLTRFPMSFRVRYRCIVGYMLKGKSGRKCKGGGKWTKPPICVKGRGHV